MFVYSSDFYADRLLHFITRHVTDRMIYDAMNWYPEAYDWTEETAQRYGVPISDVAGCISALSPQCSWEKNLVYADRMIRAFVVGDDCPRVNLPQHRYRAWDVLHTGNIGLIRGLKTANFYRNIMGDTDAVTLDSHMGFVFFGYERKFTPKHYGICTQAVRNVADRLGIVPSIVQAGGWLGMRNLKPRRKTVFQWWR